MPAVQRLVLLALVVGGFGFWVQAGEHGSARQPPNVLLLLADDFRADAIHALGQPDIMTPHLDRLVAEGTVFSRAYIMGSMVPAVCAPSRAMLLTGRTLFHLSENRTNDIRTATLWPEALRQAGYRTFVTGKWHNDPPWVARGFTDGGQLFFGGMGKHDGLLVSDFDPTGRYARTNRHNIRGFSSEVFADTAVRFLRGQKGDQPFFMYVAFTAPHDPRTPPKKFRDLYPPAKLALPKNYLPQHMFDNGEMTVRDEKLAPWPRTPETIRTNLADYYGMITHLDEQIGRILAALAETGRADNTLVIFAGDNGLALGSHGLLGKQNLYEHSVRVPLVIRGPGIQRGLRSEALCYLLDLFPTVCELAGVAIPATVEGQSLAPVLQGKAAKGRQSIYCAYGNVQRSVRDERWKLICYTHINKAQLFDLQTDPIEMNDLIAVPAQAARVQTLVAQLTNWQAQLGDRQPLTTNPPAPALFLPRPELPQPARRIKP